MASKFNSRLTAGSVRLNRIPYNKTNMCKPREPTGNWRVIVKAIPYSTLLNFLGLLWLIGQILIKRSYYDIIYNMSYLVKL